MRLGLTLAVLLAGAPAAAQFRIQTRAVLVDVSVTRGDAPVEGLGPDDFQLFVNDVPTDFRLLDSDALSVSVLFALDESSSTRGDRYQRLIDGARTFAAGMTERDSCAVVAFARLARWVHPFGPCPEGLDFGTRRTAGGATALRDGVILSLATLHDDRGRGVFLLFTDGEDNLSWSREEHLRSAARASEALFYAILAPAPVQPSFRRPQSRGVRLLEEVAEASGGRVVVLESDRDVDAAYREILRELKVRYVLSFTPDLGAEGFVPIRVRVPGRGIRVRARNGYVNSPPP